MGIENFILRRCNQTAVYWAPTGDDGYGGKTFSDPVEIKCRWEDRRDVISDNEGNEVISRAVVYPTEDVAEEGMLYLGTLDDLYDEAESSAGAINDPISIDGAWTIRRFDKIPSLRISIEFIRKAYLTP